MDYPVMYELARNYEIANESMQDYDGTTFKIVQINEKSISVTITSTKYEYTIHQSFTGPYRREQFHKRTGKFGKKETTFLRARGLTIGNRGDFANLTVE